MAELRNGNTITTEFRPLVKSPLDNRLLLTKDQMLNVTDDSFMPDRYLTVCEDSDKAEIYLFDKYNDWSMEGTDLGKFRLLKSNITVADGLEFTEDQLLSLKLGDRLTFDLDGNIALEDVPEDFSVSGEGVDMVGNIISLKYDDDTLKIDPDGRLYANVEGLNLSAKPPVKLEDGEISLLYDNSTLKIKTSTGKLYVPIDGTSLKMSNSKLGVQVDNDTIKLGSHGLYATAVIPKRMVLSSDSNGGLIDRITGESISYNRLREAFLDSNVDVSYLVYATNNPKPLVIEYFYQTKNMYLENSNFYTLTVYDETSENNIIYLAETPDEQLVSNLQ